MTLKNGADTIIETLVNTGIEVCFTNPGTSEMHLLSAIDRNDKMKAVLGLFEGVVTGAADGYGRMSGKPAATLLHLGPGLGNGIANLHNANKARTPIVNLIGEHATDHLKYNAPLTSDIEGLATPVSSYVKTLGLEDDLGKEIATSVKYSLEPNPGVSTVIVPANLAWGDMGKTGTYEKEKKSHTINAENVQKAIETLSSESQTLLFIGNKALSEEGLRLAGSIKAKNGCDLLAPTFNARIPRGEGRVPIEKLPYFSEAALGKLSLYKSIILIGASAPVSFFGYPGKEGYLVPEGTELIEVCKPGEGEIEVLKEIMAGVKAEKETPVVAPLMPPALMTGELNPASIGAAVGHFMPEGAIVSDESATSGLALGMLTQNAASHDWMDLTGGSIGQGMPLAVGAAIACPDRPVICLSGDGSAMYTNQSLWTMARENLNITTVIFANKSYAILNVEFARVGAGLPGEKAKAMMSMDNPEISFCDMAKSMGVKAERVETADEFNAAYKKALANEGPNLIEAMVDPISLG